ncbi:recombinase family protein [Rhizobium sp. BR 315]|uniref:recombinase family protein n=1 Tax=Rhizobium sp. BR 315 TaxID=3040014 RepID=UPI003D347289
MEGFDSTMARIGYARVSTVDQHLDLQKDALLAAGCSRIFEDCGVSGAEWQRNGLDKMLRALRRGDILIVWKLDRLGRSLGHLVTVIERLRRRGVEFQSLTESIDTSSPTGKLLFHIVASIAEFEKSLLRERTIAGIESARARGKQPGRRRALTEEQCREIRDALAAGSNLREIANRYRVHPRTITRGMDRLIRTG